MDFLLKYPNIDVNKSQTEGATPFYIACARGHQEVVLVILKDLRINVNKPNHNQLSPLSYASQEGHLSVLQSILASGRDVNTWVKSIASPASWNDKTAVEIARAQGTRAKSAHETEEDHTRKQQNGPLIAALLDSFEQDSQQVRAQLRKQLDFPGSIFFFLLLFLLSF